MTLSTRQIQAFVTIAAPSSFSQATNILGVTQPSLSLFIREMERMPDLPLFDRNTRGVRLSRAGQNLLPIAEPILTDLRRIEETAGDFATLSRGEMRGACSAVPAAGPLPIAIRRFERDFPGIRIIIKDTAEQNLADLVRGNHVDFAFATQVETDPRIHQELLRSDQMAAYVAPDQPFAQAKTIRWSELGDTPLALLDRKSPLRHIVDRIAGRLGIWLDTRYEVAFGTTALALAEQQRHDRQRAPLSNPAQALVPPDRDPQHHADAAGEPDRQPCRGGVLAVLPTGHRGLCRRCSSRFFR